MAGAICRNLEQSSVLIFHVIMAQLKTFPRPNFFPKKVTDRNFRRNEQGAKNFGPLEEKAPQVKKVDWTKTLNKFASVFGLKVFLRGCLQASSNGIIDAQL